MLALSSPFTSPLAFLPASGLLALSLAIAGVAQAQDKTPNASELSRVDVAGTEHRVMAPPGARIEKVVALDAPRLISFGVDGEMFIGSQADKVYRLAPPYDEAEVLVELDGYPHSVVQRGDSLYVATTDGLYRAKYQSGADLGEEDFELVAEIPGGGGHSSRSLTLGPDGRLYVSLGIQGNCSDQYIGKDYAFEDWRGGVMVLDESGDTPQWQPYATGLRNPIGMAWSHDGVLYINNNGPDHWGYALPREVLVRAERGSFFGMPWFQWVDGEFKRDDCIDSQPPRKASEATPPVVTFPARSAPMGLTFLPEDSGLAVDMITALHGSWGTQPDGSAAGDPSTRREPALMSIRLSDDGTEGEVGPLITGFQNDQGQRWARPIGVAYGPDGALYFTSDEGETGLYRLTIDGQPIDADTTLDKATDGES
ncbi:Glucose/arabinose dehydrogenase, beta-propeller fold [Modicisalibacter muralis]|uniref:Glucose/arabinose dehydrogenase, beta-propeller fold n=1 Tax=Modicisalibacter muralis TaxID=119000 RepID=A0A1G9I626_9GAMM|nr:PQQ-dependent sugar dehydrogenase [Halomonas muralis]SDL20708.1 Glucose/arabinose dehydrogenase, beta-propeller fold [Halomonas muralis]